MLLNKDITLHRWTSKLLIDKTIM